MDFVSEATGDTYVGMLGIKYATAALLHENMHGKHILTNNI